MEDNKTLKIIGITCGVLLALSCCCGGIGAMFMGSVFNAEAKQTTDAFLDDLARGDYNSARQRMNGTYQNMHDVTSFQSAVSQLPALTTHTDHTMNNVQIQPNSAQISGTLDTPQGSVPIQFNCSKIGEYWYIDAVIVGGVPLQ